MRSSTAFCLSALLPLLLAPQSPAQSPAQSPGRPPSSELERRLLAEPAAALGAEAERDGDARRGAMLFFQQRLACAKCHLNSGGLPPLGPDLAQPPEGKAGTPEHLVNSLLRPSQDLRKGFQPTLLRLDDGRTVRGLVVDEGPEQLSLRDIAREGAVVRVDKSAIEGRKLDDTSLMPRGLAGQLGGRQQFLDLVKYLLEISRGGPERAAELQPPLALMGVRPLPEYESRVDHRGLLSSLDDDALRRGEQVYSRLCVNCHGTHDKPGSLPTSLRFASGQFKRGADPYSMYLTLTHGFGQMAAQTWMVPTQKYDVIHYIRERYLKPRNPQQYFALSDSYLDSLPAGDTRGPAPVKFEPWVTMDYGPTLAHTYEVGSDATNFAYKGLAVRLDEGPGGVTRGRQWMLFDEDTLRWAAAWSGQGFIDFNGIMFNGRHNAHPRLTGDIAWANPTGPGWGRPRDASFDDPRLRGRDDRPYGPLPRSWAHFRGLHHYGSRAIVSYTVDGAAVLEMPAVEPAEGLDDVPVFSRTLNIEPRRRDLVVAVARGPQGARLRTSLQDGVSLAVIGLDGEDSKDDAADDESPRLRFDGRTYAELPRPASRDLTRGDYTVHARIKTREGGVIFAKTAAGPKWVPDGKALFVRGGRLVFDIGWVGAVTGRTRIDDGKPHDVALTWQSDGAATLYVDGRPDGAGRLEPKQPVKDHVVRFGFAAPNFPEPSLFEGEIQKLSFHPRLLDQQEIKQLGGAGPPKVAAPALAWNLASGSLKDAGGKVAARLVRAEQAQPAAASSGRQPLVAAVVGLPAAQWQLSEDGDLRLRIPAGGSPLRLTLRVAAAAAGQLPQLSAAMSRAGQPMDLGPLTRGGPARWGVDVPAPSLLGDDSQPLALDILGHPQANPWLCRVRLTGIDFFPGGQEAAVCTWDGDVWRVRGIDRPEDGLQWRRIASGMFQPLGVKIVGQEIYISCRDQIAILRDLNGDGETDFYENFNNDHQVTEHFHEFAMGLQRDAEGSFYYAKSARHALPALVPHHGTLLKVSADGQRTEIVATGFRAANGVCLNPDGSFIVTDQEGHWNPKNRINWVEPGGFYGNMYGYHDVTDSSDDAMQQPLCWITNSFDRSPAELLWADSPQWGPLQGSLLSLSYGYGRIFIVPHERVDGQIQGGMCQLPIPDAPTGLIRGRFHPGNGQLYACGMFAWAGSKQQPGGLYRVRYTGRPVHLPVGLQATKAGMRMTFSGQLDEKVAADPGRYQVKIWSLKRTKNYGSKHYDERPLQVAAARVGDDGRTVEIELEGMRPTWCMEIKYQLQGAGGEPVEGVIHNTVHRLGE